MIKKENLYKSPVQFYEQEHEYWLGMDQLVGVTTILNTVLFPDKYAGIAPDVLAKAAAKGTAIHNAVQAYETFETYENCEALDAWIKWTDKDKYVTWDCEYLVSDEQRIASKVDMVMAQDSDIWLADIKTTKVCDREYLAWQLSFYAEMFEAQTGLPVAGIVGFWWSGKKWEEVLLERKSAEDVKSVIEDYFNGVVRQPAAPQVPAEVTSLADAIADMERTIKEQTAKRDELKDKMLQLMKEHGCKKVDLDGKVLVTYVEPTTREAFDSKTFKADHPDMYAGYVKTSPVKESLKITVR